MSIASEISRLTTLRNNIRTKLIALGIISDASANLASCYTGLNAVTRKDAATYTPTTTDQTIASGQYLYGAQTISGDANLIESNIKNGVSIFGVNGNYAPTISTQEKSATPSTVQQEVTPDSGKLLSKVTVLATPLETPSTNVTPSTTQQVITPTPGSGNIGLTQVVVEGDADLIASNIKIGVNIFNVLGTYEAPARAINGSLIEVTCSSNIDSVTATVNGNTYSAYKSGNKAYITIPYTDTTSAVTCVLVGYNNGTQVTSASLPMNSGVGYYTATLSVSEYVFRSGTGFEGYTYNGFTINQSSYDPVFDSYSVSSQYITVNLSQRVSPQSSGKIALTNEIYLRGYSKVSITTIGPNSCSGTYPVLCVSSYIGGIYDTTSNYTTSKQMTSGNRTVHVLDVPQNAINQGYMYLGFYCGNNVHINNTGDYIQIEDIHFV